MRFIDSLESKLGRFAIPGLVQVIALFQLGVLVLVLMMSKDSAQTYVDLLTLDMDRVMHGQVWRLVTHVFIPHRFNILWAVLGTLIHSLAWGAAVFMVTYGKFSGDLAFTVGLSIFSGMGAASSIDLVLLLLKQQFAELDKLQPRSRRSGRGPGRSGACLHGPEHR